MAALLVAMALMAVFMSVALPVYRQASQREKEAELIWRGQQYDRAIQLFRKKFGAPGPPNLDILIKQRLLRKKYKDPITNADFELKGVGPSGLLDQPGTTRRPGAGMLSRSARRGGPQSQDSEEAAQAEQAEERVREEQGPTGRARRPGGRTRGQLIGGVRSKSTAKSIRVLNGKTRYNQWEFTYIPYGTKTQSAQPNTGQPNTSPRPGVGNTRPTPR